MKTHTPPNHHAGIELLESRIAPAAFVVTNLADAGAGSLRQAVFDANAAATDDVITFATGLSGQITLTTGEIAVTDDVTISGGGIKISGNNASRIFNIDDAAAGTEINVKVTNLNFVDGSETDGGAIYSVENLTVNKCLFKGNDATTSFGGAIRQADSTSSLVIKNSRFIGNQSFDDSGAVDVFAKTLLIKNSVFSGNKTTGASGQAGAIYLSSVENAAIKGSQFLNNLTTDGLGGAIYHAGGALLIQDSIISGNAANGALQRGGGIYTDGTLNLTNTKLISNTATGDGGGIYAASSSNVVLDGSKLHKNTSGDDGGGISSEGSLFITSSKITKNTAADFGGGIRTEETGTGDFALINSTVKLNVSSNNGGGISLFNTGSQVIEFSKILSNTATSLGGGLRAGNGFLTVISTTIANNSAANGGGASLADDANPHQARFYNSSIINNTASTDGGGIRETMAANPILLNTLVSGNTAPANPNLSGTYTII